MSGEPIFSIDLNYKFEHLRRAPIIEAVMDIRTRVSDLWSEKRAKEVLNVRIPEYPVTHSITQFMHEFSVGPNRNPQPQKNTRSWNGIRIETADHIQIAQFNRNGFVFSRLHPYENWDRFIGEALRLWMLYKELVKPVQIERIGVRFINRMDVAQKDFRIDDYLQDIPKYFLGSEFHTSGFLYNDILEIPGYLYVIKVVRTIQPLQPDAEKKIGVIIDIDVFTKQDFSANPADILDKFLSEMRWLKNKIFFQSITSKAKEMFL
jgi:uncharacterized protein (TIGR04255 family)